MECGSDKNVTVKLGLAQCEECMGTNPTPEPKEEPKKEVVMTDLQKEITTFGQELVALTETDTVIKKNKKAVYVTKCTEAIELLRKAYTALKAKPQTSQARTEPKPLPKKDKPEGDDKARPCKKCNQTGQFAPGKKCYGCSGTGWITKDQLIKQRDFWMKRLGGNEEKVAEKLAEL
jgi:hypothetical protein